MKNYGIRWGMVSLTLGLIQMSYHVTPTSLFFALGFFSFHVAMNWGDKDD